MVGTLASSLSEHQAQLALYSRSRPAVVMARATTTRNSSPYEMPNGLLRPTEEANGSNDPTEETNVSDPSVLTVQEPNGWNAPVEESIRETAVDRLPPVRNDTLPEGPARSRDLTESPTWHLFSGNDNENRYHRLRCSAALMEFNGQSLTTSMQDRSAAWYRLLEPFATTNDQRGAPLVKSPFYCDYGNINVAPSAYIHRGVYIGDNPKSGAEVKIGEGVFIGPSVQIFTVKHDVDWRKRRSVLGPALASSVIICDDAYIGAGACILPSVTIGKCSVVGTGTVVTKSIPAYHVAAGSPARPVRKVALDVPDAPGLQYEMRGGQMMVLYNSSSGVDLSTSSRQEDNLPTVSTHSDNASTERHNPMPAGLLDSSFAGSQVIESEQDPILDSTSGKVLWAPGHVGEVRIGRSIAVDLALLVLSLAVGGAIIHIVLY